MAAGAGLLVGRSPYGQWFRFRAGRLVIGTNKSRSHDVALGAATAKVLAGHRPETETMIGTAASSREADKLRKSRQLYVAVCEGGRGVGGLEGIGEFSGRDIPRNAPAVLDAHLLLVVTTRDDVSATSQYSRRFILSEQ